MPIYEYQCRSCGSEFQTLVMKIEHEQDLVCPSCGGEHLTKLISRVVYHMSEGDRLDNFDPSRKQDDSFYKDTRNIGLHAKKRAQQLGVDLGSGFEDKVEKLRTDPGSVIKDSE
ncbi:MAG: zinc ribbon domain-containing protein [Desulfatiglans sp.]|nr:zinc ribbon domain-containing protein [Desulfatiglans sp.]